MKARTEFTFWEFVLAAILILGLAGFGLHLLRNTVRITIEIGAPRAAVAPTNAPANAAEIIRALPLPKWEPVRTAVSLPPSFHAAAFADGTHRPRSCAVPTTVVPAARGSFFDSERSLNLSAGTTVQGCPVASAAIGAASREQISSSRERSNSRSLDALSSGDHVSRAAAANRSTLWRCQPIAEHGSSTKHDSSNWIVAAGAVHAACAIPLPAGVLQASVSSFRRHGMRVLHPPKPAGRHDLSASPFFRASAISNA